MVGAGGHSLHTGSVNRSYILVAALSTLAVCVGGRRAAGQQRTGVAAADSASVAREAWARAGAALGNHDDIAARREVERAAEAWPVQPAYVWASAVLAAHAGDTLATLAALDRYAGMGLGHDLRSDSVLAAMTAGPAFAQIVDAHRTNRAPLARSRELVALADSTFWPEGMDVDPRTGTIYVASVRHRTVAAITPNGGARELIARGRRDLGAILGVRVDTARGVLWATTSGIPQMQDYLPADSAIASLLRIRMSDGTIERRWNLPAVPGGHVLGDLAVGPEGDVFVTDSYEPVLYRLRPNADRLDSIRNPLFHSLQGLAPSPDGRALYLSDYSIGLLRVDLATNAVVRVADAPHTTSLGCDGIAWDRGAIVAVQNGVAPARIVRFVLDDAGTRVARVQVLDRHVPVADEPTIGAVRGREFLYVANSQWDKHDDHGRPIPGRTLTPPIILALPLPR